MNAVLRELNRHHWQMRNMLAEFNEPLPFWLAGHGKTAAFYQALSEYYKSRAFYEKTYPELGPYEYTNPVIIERQAA